MVRLEELHQVAGCVLQQNLRPTSPLYDRVQHLDALLLQFVESRTHVGYLDLDSVPATGSRRAQTRKGLAGSARSRHVQVEPQTLAFALAPRIDTQKPRAA